MAPPVPRQSTTRYRNRKLSVPKHIYTGNHGLTTGVIFAAVAIVGLAFWFSERNVSALAVEEEECKQCASGKCNCNK